MSNVDPSAMIEIRPSAHWTGGTPLDPYSETLDHPAPH